MAVPVPDDETGRLAALAHYQILDTPPEPCFDRLTALLTDALRVPIGQINFIDENRTWPKSSRGLDVPFIPRGQSFCAHTILSDDVLIVPDLREDSRFFDNPYVTGAPFLRFYAGAPLKSPDGHRLGTACVYDTSARHDWDSRAAAGLRNIADIAMDEVEYRLSALGEKAREWMRAEMEASPAGISIVSEQGAFVDVNPAFCAMTGYVREELIGRSFTVTLPPEARERAARNHDSVLCGRTFPLAEAVLLRKDGRRVATYAIDARVERPDGKYCVSTFIDVSELKRNEEQVRRYQKLEAVRRLAGGVAHNINNLLTIIVGYSQILADSMEEADPRKRYTGEISAAADRAAFITAQLLTFSRHGVIAPRVLDINAIVESMEEELRELLGDTVAFTCRLRPGVGKIRAGAGQIEQILRNLALNSREAMTEGGSFAVETSEIELDEDYARSHPGVHPGQYTLLTVTDTGRGMDEDTRSHLFEPYFTTKGIGKGAGLAVVYGIVRQCGGDLAIHSEPGGGTTIGLYFPRAEERPAVESKRPETASGNKLLVVEDDKEVRQAIRQMLEAQGHAVLEAATAEEAARIWNAEGSAIRALISDVALPDRTGPELGAALSSSRPGLPILFISGFAEDMLGDLESASANALFLQKPFDAETLRATLRKLLEPV